MNKALRQNIEFCIENSIANLPDDLKWAPHNLIAHPLMEILFQVGLERASEYVHEITIPRGDDDSPTLG
tara:strand:- start:362 stop:568 length:207 start_codon:yes stop_codon:yes gene_type:complete